MYNLENFYDFRTACVNACAWLERNRPKEGVSISKDTILKCNIRRNVILKSIWIKQILFLVLYFVFFHEELMKN